MKPKRRVVKPELQGIAHSQRLISILDNLVAACATAFFAGMIVPQWCGTTSQIDWVIEGLLALAIISLYATGMFIQEGMKK